MPELYEIFDRLKATLREYRAVADAVEQQLTEVQGGRSEPPSGTSLQDYASARLHLEPTYLVRMWAEFESALRSYRRYLVKDPGDNIRAFDLINWARGIEAGRKVDDAYADLVHEVRRYRNSLVHEREEAIPAVALEEARHRLSAYLSKLPPHWPT